MEMTEQSGIATEETGLRSYELAYLFVPSLSEEEADKELAGLKGLVSSEGGSLFAEGAPTLIDLAYEMEKVVENKKSVYASAHFGWFKCDLPAGALEGMRKALDANPSIIRYLLVKTDKEQKGGKKVPGDAPQEEGSKASESLDEKIDELAEV